MFEAVTGRYGGKGSQMMMKTRKIIAMMFVA